MTYIFRSLLFLVFLLSMSAASFAQIGVGVSVNFAPPPLPVYEQPVCPGDGYIWTPGYWSWDGDDYFWVPGTWVLAPEVGFLWTPGYWGWGGSGFFFHEGYWGPTVGFYGGINYGFGYFGHGFEGGRWDQGHFYYNRAVSNVNVTEIHNVYNTTVVNEHATNHVSYNGGNGGITDRATPAEEAAARERHVAPVAAQTQQVQAARANRELRASVNQGKPPIAATQRPGEFSEHAVAAKEAGGHYEPPASHGTTAAHPAVHPNELPPQERPAPVNSGNAKADQKYQQQQEKLYAKQEQERQKLQQQQDKEHQKAAKQHADAAKMQQMEQRHQQQTQQLQQRHAQEQQQLQRRAPQPHPAPAHPGRP